MEGVSCGDDAGFLGRSWSISYHDQESRSGDEQAHEGEVFGRIIPEVPVEGICGHVERSEALSALRCQRLCSQYPGDVQVKENSTKEAVGLANPNTSSPCGAIPPLLSCPDRRLHPRAGPGSRTQVHCELGVPGRVDIATTTTRPCSRVRNRSNLQ